MTIIFIISFFFFFNDTATTEIYTLSLHDALPICIIAEDFTFANACIVAEAIARYVVRGEDARKGVIVGYDRSEEHTSELQSPCNLVCRLLLEKKKKQKKETCL